MTRKDYILIAASLHFVLKRATEPGHAVGPETRAVYDAALVLAIDIARQNPNFNADRFLSAVREGK